MATKIHLDHSFPLKKQWSPLRQFPLGDGETSTKYEAWSIAYLVGKVVLLSLLKDVMNLLLEGLDPFNQYSYMIYLSVGGLFR
jgi:hypothetical protein